MAEDEGCLMKPPTFTGLESEWQEWSFVMRAYLAGKLGQGQALLTAADNLAGDPDISLAALGRASREAAQDSRKMFFTLVMTAKGPAQMVMRGQEQHNGAACWRALCQRYEPATAVRAQSIMSAVLTVPQFPDSLSEFEDKHGEWERDIRRYETASGELFNEGVRKTIFLQKAPTAIRTMLHLQSDRSYAELVATVVQYLQASTPHSSGQQ